MDSNQRYASPYHLPRSQRRPYHQKPALSAFCTLLEVRPLIWRGRRTPIPRCAGRFHGRRSESRHEIRFRSMPRSLIPVMTPHGSLRLDQADDDFVLEGGLRLAAPAGVVGDFGMRYIADLCALGDAKGPAGRTELAAPTSSRRRGSHPRPWSRDL